MKKIKDLALIAVTFLSQYVGAQNLTSKTVEYGPAGQKFVGYTTAPMNLKKSTPGILIIHNWMGLTDETKKQADRFAKLGYVVFAADIYGKDQGPKDVKAAGALAGKYKADRKLFRERLNLALTELKKQKNVDGKQLVVAGYCFGGTGALELVRSGADIVAAISFHGGLDSPTPADGKNIKAKVLALHGAIDPFVSATDVNAFEDEMKNNNIDYQLVKYGNAVHSFTEIGAGNDNSKGAAYNESSDRRSFVAADNFLKENFKFVK